MPACKGRGKKKYGAHWPTTWLDKRDVTSPHILTYFCVIPIKYDARVQRMHTFYYYKSFIVLVTLCQWMAWSADIFCWCCGFVCSVLQLVVQCQQQQQQQQPWTTRHSNHANTQLRLIKLHRIIFYIGYGRGKKNCTATGQRQKYEQK